METINWKNTLFIGGTFLCALAYKILRSKKDNMLDSSINEVLFYGAQEESKRKEIGLDNLFCIYYVIAHASRTVDVCVPSLESETITKCLLRVHRKDNMQVRVAVHKSNQLDNLMLLIDQGIEVKVVESTEPIEHEFILIDASENLDVGMAIIGSLDYETTRVNCNRDTTFLTSKPCVVSILKKEFDRIWHETPETIRRAIELDQEE
ncbi:unnamed protein product [Diatraea saccharalis]|uniref:Mitochondrial cardiolipin hydrolase n=1 Tax=Diatraea saccharalis TaxID=40085 RepID=A0A9N9WK91_9NEOP|nr:unnamed protein product [Diatraea saccharalis]